MLDDQPFDYSAHFHLYEKAPALFDPLREAIFHIEALSQKGSGLLIGIKGDWGTGKTSLLHGLERYFKHFREWPTVFFDAWKYQEEDHPLIPLLLKLEKVTQGKTKKGLKSLANSLAASALVLSDILLKEVTGRAFPAGKVGLKEIKNAFDLLGGASMERHSKYDENFSSLEKMIGEIAGKARAGSDPEENEKWKTFREKAGLLTEDLTNRYLLILVDDLDRLLPEGALKVLEAIRFYLQVPKAVIIMGINDKVLAPYIEKRYDKLISGESFMEKVFQWSIELPHLGFMPQIEGIHFREVLEKSGMEGFESELRELGSKIDSLPHRKWNRIANRLETLTEPGQKPRFPDLWISIFEECFPKAEQFLREFPQIKDEISSDFERAKGDQAFAGVIGRIEEIVKYDTSYFRLPEENLKRMIEVQKTIIRA